MKWAIPEKIQTGGVLRIYFFEPPPTPTPSPPRRHTHPLTPIPPTPPWNFSFFYFTLGNSRQSKAQPMDILQNCVRYLLEIPKLQSFQLKDPYAWKSHIYMIFLLLLVTLALLNFISFLINPWKFHMLFLWYPWKFHILNAQCNDWIHKSLGTLSYCPIDILVPRNLLPIWDSCQFDCTFCWLAAKLVVYNRL